MRATIHNGRTSKDGAYNPKHNDRQFDISHAEHIDPEKMKDNRYWNWTGDPGKTFEAAEAAFYEKYIRKHLDAQNARYKAQRHAERAKSMDEYRKSPQTCPEETILMIGKAGDTIPADMMARIVQEQINWEQKLFPGVKVLDVALHVDEEGAPHIHARRAWVYTDKDGNFAISQGKSLEQMGVELPNPDKPRGRFNNRKMTFSQMCREHLLQICRQHGLEIEEIPQEKSKSGLTQTEYKARQEQERTERAEYVRHIAETSLQYTQQEQTAAQQDMKTCDEYTRQLQQQIAIQQEELADIALQQHEIHEQIEQLQEERQQQYNSLMQLTEARNQRRKEVRQLDEEVEAVRDSLSQLQGYLTQAETRRVWEICQEHERSR